VIQIFAPLDWVANIYKIRENYQCGVGLEPIEKVLLKD
jgi:hypothetical protein